MTAPGGGGVLETRDLAVGYRGPRRKAVVLDGLDLRLEPGGLTCLLGPNGSGKSTLLRTLAGLQEPLAGEVRLLGDALWRLGARERARRLAVVLTDAPDVGLMRAADLVALGRHPHTAWTGRLRAYDHACVRWALEATGAAALATRSVAELSDGERQRVLIARALAQQPQVLALDEPVAFVDVPRRVELTQLLRDLARECDLAVLLTTHDLDLAIRTADRLWLVEPGGAGERARVHVGAPEDLVLSGAVARAFASAEVTFDLEQGAFRPRPGTLGRVRVVGEGPAAVWAARALERAGFVAVAGLAGVRGRDGEDGPAGGEVLATVEVGVRGGQDRWRLAVAGKAVDHTRVGDLVADLGARLPALAAAQARPAQPTGPAH